MKVSKEGLPVSQARWMLAFRCLGFLSPNSFLLSQESALQRWGAIIYDCRPDSTGSVKKTREGASEMRGGEEGCTGWKRHVLLHSFPQEKDKQSWPDSSPIHLTLRWGRSLTHTPRTSNLLLRFSQSSGAAEWMGAFCSQHIQNGKLRKKSDPCKCLEEKHTIIPPALPARMPCFLWKEPFANLKVLAKFPCPSMSWWWDFLSPLYPGSGLRGMAAVIDISTCPLSLFCVVSFFLY